MNLRIKEYRIVEHPYYLGWVIVEQWNGERYVPGPAFRSVEEAEQFTGNTMKGEA